MLDVTPTLPPPKSTDDGRPRGKPALELWAESAAVHAARFPAGPPGLVGRGAGCRLQLTDPDVSEKHAAFICHDSGNWWVYDLGSRNGVYVNGQKVLGRRLEDGHAVRVGDRGYKVRFVHQPQDWVIDDEKNRFELVRPIHAGTMGELFLARWAGFDGRPAAVRVFPDGFEESAEDTARFLRGSEAGGELRHLNLVRLYRGGRTTKPWRGRLAWWLAMEYMPGGSLRDRVTARGPLPLADVIRLGADLASALGEIAGRGLVHRNVNPSCVLFAADGSAKLGDFFLLRREVMGSIAQASEAAVPQSEFVYHPPEQLDGSREATTAADVYGLGGCLYLALTGLPPFDPNQPLPKLFDQIRRQEVASPRGLNPLVPSGLDDLVRRTLAKDPAARPKSPEDLLGELLTFSAK